jgi:hypothetical protein
MPPALARLTVRNARGALIELGQNAEHCFETAKPSPEEIEPLAMEALAARGVDSAGAFGALSGIIPAMGVVHHIAAGRISKVDRQSTVHRVRFSGL